MMSFRHADICSLKVSFLAVLASASLVLGAVGCVNGNGGGTPTPDAGGDVGNQAPTASASAPNQGGIGTTVTLDGSASSDPDGDSLTFSWTIVSAPSGSSATLQSPNSAMTDIQLDVAGTYEFELTVDDGQATSTDSVSVTATNQAPTADAGSGATVLVGDSATLDGSASSDPDGDSLSFAWSIVASPSGSSATITNPNQQTASITPDVAGDYTVELEVSDGTDSDTDRVTISASANQPGTVVYVRQSGSDDNPGTEDFPVATLEEGMSLARNTSSVERINLDAATYDQGFRFVIDKELTITGEGSDSTILDAGGSAGFKIETGGALTLIDLAVENGDPAIDGEKGRFDGNRWRCEASPTCIAAGDFFSAEGSDVSLTDSTLIGDGTSSGAGVRYNSGNMTMNNTTVRNFGIGVLPAGTGLRMQNSTVENCETGVQALNASLAAIDIIGSTFTGNGLGVDLTAAQDVLIDNSTFESHGTRAILAQSNSTLVIQDSTIQGSARSGIRAQDTSVITLANNTIHDNGTGNPSQFTDRAGVFLTGDAQLSGSDGGTEIYGHPQDNIVFQGGSSGTLLNFTVRDATKAGVFVSTTEKVIVDGGTYENNENGFFVSDDSSLEVTGATVTENSKDGINFGGSGTLSVRDTDVTLNEENQFHIRNDPSGVDLGTSGSHGNNLIEMASSSNWGILDARPALGSATGTVITAAGNTYVNGALQVEFENSALDGQYFTGPKTYLNTSPGDDYAIFKIANNNREMSF